LRGEGRFFFSEDKKQKTFASDALKRDAISLNRFRLPHPALARCFHEHVYPAANRIQPDHALVHDAAGGVDAAVRADTAGAAGAGADGGCEAEQDQGCHDLAHGMTFHYETSGAFTFKTVSE